MIQRLRELGCVIFGHDWHYYDPYASRRTPGETNGRTHKQCRRCYRNDLNL